MAGSEEDNLLIGSTNLERSADDHGPLPLPADSSSTSAMILRSVTFPNNLLQFALLLLRFTVFCHFGFLSID
jgi:hypothetical protein